jgi:hypothetical protein
MEKKKAKLRGYKNSIRLFPLLLVASWFVAFWWMDHGRWWASNFPTWAWDAISFLAYSRLIENAADAEDIVYFFAFWAPSLLVLVFLAFSVFILHKSRK